jgi:hypothetical protein
MIELRFLLTRLGPSPTSSGPGPADAAKVGSQDGQGPAKGSRAGRLLIGDWYALGGVI